MRVLLMAEAVTLSQVTRLVSLASGLDRREFDVHFASAQFDPLVFDGANELTRHSIFSLAAGTVERGVLRGARVYDRPTLERYVRDELELLERIRPDVVVGDLRWSLSVSAAVKGVPYAALVNAYWSPFAQRERFPLPDHPIVRLLGVRLAERYFPKALPHVMAHQAAPLDAIRKHHGLPPLGDLRNILVHADLTLFPDTPALVPCRGAPSCHRYIGPVIWSPRVSLPAFWSELPRDTPLVYVTLGSSGLADCLPEVLRGVCELPVEVVCASAGRRPRGNYPDRVHFADYLPGDVLARRAAAVVCNGGSSTAYQALAAGTPVLGVASNLDQYLAIDAIRSAGAGLGLRAASVRSSDVSAALRRLLDDTAYREAARRVQSEFSKHDALALFPRLLRELSNAARTAP